MMLGWLDIGLIILTMGFIMGFCVAMLIRDLISKNKKEENKDSENDNF